MASSARSRLSVDVRREQLLTLGLDLFSGQAFDEISIDEIARRAGISKGLLYHYFPSKRDFHFAVVAHAASELRVVTEPDRNLPKFEQLTQSLNAYLDYVENHADGYVSLFRGGGGVDDAIMALVEESREALAQRTIDGLPLTSGEITPVLRLAVRGWIGFVEATSLDWLDGRHVARAELHQLMTAALLTSMQAAMAVDPTLEFDLEALGAPG